MIWEEGENIFFQKLQKLVSLNDLRSRVESLGLNFTYKLPICRSKA
jgi:hypothetical protein